MTFTKNVNTSEVSLLHVSAGCSLMSSEDCTPLTCNIHGARRNNSFGALIFVLWTFMCIAICAVDIHVFWYLCCGHSRVLISVLWTFTCFDMCCGHSHVLISVLWTFTCFDICAVDIHVFWYVLWTFTCFDICAVDIHVFWYVLWTFTCFNWNFNPCENLCLYCYPLTVQPTICRASSLLLRGLPDEGT